MITNIIRSYIEGFVKFFLCLLISIGLFIGNSNFLEASENKRIGHFVFVYESGSIKTDEINCERVDHCVFRIDDNLTTIVKSNQQDRQLTLSKFSGCCFFANAKSRISVAHDKKKFSKIVYTGVRKGLVYSNGVEMGELFLYFD